MLLFGAGYAAAYVPPDRGWWLQLVAVWLPYLSLGVPAAAVMVALAGRWKSLGVHVLCCGLALGRFFSFNGFDPSPGEAPVLTVMTFNAAYKYWTGGEGRRDTGEERARDMAALMQRERPDVAALQGVGMRFPAEGPRPSQAHTRALLGLGYTVLPPDTLRGALNQPVFSRIPQRRVATLIPTGEEEDEKPYAVTRTVLEWQGRKVVVYNLHLRSFYDDGRRPWEGGLRRALNPKGWLQWLGKTQADFVARAGEAAYVRRLLNAETRPFIVCGDFNATPHNWAYRRISHGLTDAFRRRGRGFGGTYHARLPLLRIDHVLVSPDWRVDAAAVVSAGFSDHRPMVVRLALRRR